jgi:methionyl-tRNA formyltransferase
MRLIQPERLRDAAVEETLRGWGPDLGVVAAYGRLIPVTLLAVPRLGMINVHASLLPKYRGASPVHRAVMNGDLETGITIMRVAEALDTGDMLAHVGRPIAPDETSDAVERDLAGLGARLLVDMVDSLADGTATETPQDHALASYAPRLTREDGIIDWSRTPTEIHNQVRGLFPWPHASTWLGGQRLIVLATKVVDDRAAPAAAGTVLGIADDVLYVAAGGGVLAVCEIQPEGRRPMAIRDYLAGHPIPVGARFGGP